MQIAAALRIGRSSVFRRSNREGWPYTEATARGGQRRLYRFSDLPEDVQAALLRAEAERSAATPAAPAYDAEALHAWAAGRPRRLRDLGVYRAGLIHQVERLMEGGSSFREAARLVAAEDGSPSPATLRNWYYGRPGRPGARTYRPQDRAAALSSHAPLAPHLPPPPGPPGEPTGRRLVARNPGVVASAGGSNGPGNAHHRPRLPQ